MTRFWTCHWQNRLWRTDINPEYEPVDCSVSNSFSKRGVSSGDVAYIISLANGQFMLGGRMIVDRIVSYQEALQYFQTENLYEAKEVILPQRGSGTLLYLHRQLAPPVARQLRFVSPKSEPKGLCFVSDTQLDVQATRGVRELTPESASLLDRIIEITDALTRTDQLITVTEEMLLTESTQNNPNQVRLPEEVPGNSGYNEGNVQRILVNRYERDPRAREDCLKYHGTACVLCGFDFGAVYGCVMTGFTHVHHLHPLSSVGPDYVVDPIKDLRPVCPNCHAVLHRREPPYSLDEVREFLQTNQTFRVR